MADIIVSPSPSVALVMSPHNNTSCPGASRTLLPQNIDTIKDKDMVDIDAAIQASSTAAIDNQTQTSPFSDANTDVSKLSINNVSTQTDLVVTTLKDVVIDSGLPASKDVINGERALDVVRSILKQLLSSHEAIATLYASNGYSCCQPVGEVVKQLTHSLKALSSDLVWANLMLKISEIDRER